MPVGTVNKRSKQYAFRLPHDLAARVEAYRAANGHGLISEAVRALLETGLSASGNGGMHPVMQNVIQADYAAIANRLAALEQAVRSLQGGAVHDNCHAFY